jgi:phage terminase large subunit-like protein
MAIVFKKKIGDKTHYYPFVKHYLPSEAVKKAENAAHYDGWVRRGLITVTPGAMLDVDTVEKETIEIGKNHNVIDLAFDPGHNSTQYGVHMLDAGFNVIEVRPTVMNFSDPMKWMEAFVRAGVLHHAGCPVLTWEVSNTVCKVDAKDNIYPRKEFPERKIDGVVAVLMALNRAMADENTAFDGELLVV